MATIGVVSGGSHSSYDFETNWQVAAGSLRRTIIFESSSEDSPLDAAPSSDSVNDSASSLVLKPDAPDSGPCEIKIWFLQKHEIRQIYVRSTARVCEIYYAQSLQNDNEYLCTIRCSIAQRDEQVLQASDIKESAESTKNSSVELKEEKLTAEGNNGTSEDDWVEVKVLDSSLEHRISSLSDKKSAHRRRDIQDFYEATAEISDLDPCTSITLRFLSLQNKSCVFVDEVYVFADPVTAIDSENQSQDVTSAGSSLMAMLVPTLLQLSKSGMNQIQGQQASSDLQKGSKIEIQSKSTDSTDLTSHQDEKGSCQQCSKLQRVHRSAAEPAKTQLCNQILDGDNSDDPVVKNDSPYGHIEKVLEQLVSRVGRIEEVCLRFEENLLKPLNSMEMRIQRVEQQLEVLANNSQHFGLPHCTRITAPSFSCNYNSSSLHNEACDYKPCRAPDSEKKELTSSDFSNASDGISSSANVAHHFPSLVVTAPDFSCEDDLDDDGSKTLKNSPWETKKKPLIDAVLAASLSGFLSTSTGNLSECKKTPFIAHDTSEIISDKLPSENVQALPSEILEITNDINAKEEPSRYTQVLMVMAPEFTYEEGAGEEHLNHAEFVSVAFPQFASNKSETGNHVPVRGIGNGCSLDTSDLSDINREMMSNSASIPSTVASAVFSDANSMIPDDVPPRVAAVQDHTSERSNICSSRVINVDDTGDETEDAIRTEACQTIKECDQRELVISLLPEKNDVCEQFLGHKTDDTIITGGGTECVVVEGPDKQILQNPSDSSSASLVDFGIPIVDVKFTQYGDSRTRLPLQALLDDAIDLNVEADPLQENGGEDAYAQETNLIDISDEDETGDSVTGKSLVMDLGIYDMTCEQDTVVSLI